MLLIALRSLFFVTVILGYSTGVWRLINEYFRAEFRTYLQEEVKKNKYLLVDPAAERQDGSDPPKMEIVTESEVKRASGSVTANRLLDELIIGFGRFFTTRNEGEAAAGGGKDKQRPTVSLPQEAITTNSLLLDQKQLQQRQQESTNKPKQQQQDPGGRPVPEDAIIESDKLVESSASSSSNDNDDDDGDDEEKWIKYWKNRGQRQAKSGPAGDSEQQEGNGGYCKGPPPPAGILEQGLATDDDGACGP